MFELTVLFTRVGPSTRHGPNGAIYGRATRVKAPAGLKRVLSRDALPATVLAKAPVGRKTRFYERLRALSRPARPRGANVTGIGYGTPLRAAEGTASERPACHVFR